MHKLSIAAVTLLFSLSATAATETLQSVGVSGGSIGIDVEYSRMLVPEYSLTFRVAAGGLSYSGDYDDTDTHYETDVKLMNLGATLEYHPFNNGFYLGAGAFYHDNTFDMDATPSGGKYEFNGHTYPADLIGSVAGEVTNLNNFVPYIGAGYDASLFDSGNLFFTLKAGVWYQGTPKVDLTAHDCALDQIPGSPLGCNDLRYDLLHEEQDINNDIKNYKWWPILQLGISYRF